MNKLKEELEKLNTTIKQMQDRLVEAKIAIALGEERYANEKLVLVNQIAMEKTDDGKSVYSNETKRQAKFRKLMNTGHPLQTLDAQLKDDRTKVEYAINEISFLKRKFKILIEIRGNENE